MSTTDRIRYYDGEFLRAFDFSDEQTYHVEMRRRLNRYLHLCGIVEGLTMVSPPDSYGVSINPGMAIDALGREIYVYAPYPLGDTDVRTNRITSAGSYEVWLRYLKSAGTPPSAGYANCNQTNQFTRWVESFSVILLPSPSKRFKAPGFADPDSDDPTQDHVGVLVGTVYVDPASPSKTFSIPPIDPKHDRVELLGIIAQSIQTPTSWHATKASPPFSFLNKNTPGVANTPLSPLSSLEIKPNIFADQNLIVGHDFPLTEGTSGTKISISPDPTVKDPGAGSVKIAGDLFVQGNIYNLITSETPAPVAPKPFPPADGTDLWLGLSGYVKQLVQQSLPDIAVGSLSVTVPTDSAKVALGTTKGYASNTAEVTVQSTRLTSCSSYIAFAYFSQVELDPSVGAPPPPQLSLENPPPANLNFNFTGGQSGQVSVPWKAGPAIAPGGSVTNFATKCAIDNFTICCIVILFP